MTSSAPLYSIDNRHARRLREKQARQSGASSAPPRSRLAHGLVAATATALARTMYVELMGKSNSLYTEWKARCPELTPEECEELFVAQLTPKMLEQARATLAKMLTQPLDEGLKETIAEALITDNLVRRAGKTAGHRIG